MDVKNDISLIYIKQFNAIVDILKPKKCTKIHSFIYHIYTGFH